MAQLHAISVELLFRKNTQHNIINLKCNLFIFFDPLFLLRKQHLSWGVKTNWKEEGGRGVSKYS